MALLRPRPPEDHPAELKAWQCSIREGDVAQVFYDDAHWPVSVKWCESEEDCASMQARKAMLEREGEEEEQEEEDPEAREAAALRRS